MVKGWKNGRIEIRKWIEKWKDKKVFSFLSCVWFDSRKVEDRKYRLYKFTFMPLIDKKKSNKKKIY